MHTLARFIGVALGGLMSLALILSGMTIVALSLNVGLHDWHYVLQTVLMFYGGAVSLYAGCFMFHKWAQRNIPEWL